MVLGLCDVFLCSDELGISLSALYLIPLIIGAWKFPPLHYVTLAVVISVLDNNEHIRALFRAYYGQEILGQDMLVLWNLLMSIISSVIIGSFIRFLRDLLHKEMELSRIDSLTNVLNKRGFIDSLECEVSRARRHNQIFTLAFIDVDNFKIINDKHGHIIGDHALKMIALTIKKDLRLNDVVCRFGGDEFVILLPYSDVIGTQVLLAKIKSQLDKMVARHHWNISFSIGAVVFNTLPSTIDEIVNITDDVMYGVKNSGKNGINIREYTVQENT
jgi:diguanylate cyclase (GGDEF)-like protein